LLESCSCDESSRNSSALSSGQKALDPTWIVRGRGGYAAAIVDSIDG
jgi:hypothetical protein